MLLRCGLWLALLTLEVPSAMPMCPARHYEMPECGEILMALPDNSIVACWFLLLRK